MVSTLRVNILRKVWHPVNHPHREVSTPLPRTHKDNTHPLERRRDNIRHRGRRVSIPHRGHPVSIPHHRGHRVSTLPPVDIPHQDNTHLRVDHPAAIHRPRIPNNNTHHPESPEESPVVIRVQVVRTRCKEGEYVLLTTARWREFTTRNNNMLVMEGVSRTRRWRRR